MSTAIYILGGIVFLALIASSIIDFYVGNKEKDKTRKNFLYTSGVMTGIAALIVIIMFVLLGKLTTNVQGMDESVEKMYKFSKSYLFNIPESSIEVPSRIHPLMRALPYSSPPQVPFRQNIPMR